MTGPALAAAAGLGFGVFQTLNRRAVGGLGDAYVATFLQLLIALAVLLAATAATEDLGVLGDATALSLAYFSLAGVIHFSFGWTLLNMSQMRIGAARTSPLLATNPVFGAAIAAVVLQELPGVLIWLGVALVVAGALVVSLERVAEVGWGVSWRDTAPGIATALAWATSPVLIKEGLEGLPSPLLGLTLGMVVAVLAYAAALPLRPRVDGPAISSWTSLGFKLAAGVMVGLSVWARWAALDYAEIAVVLALGLLSVPVVLLLSPLLMGRHVEHVTLQVWAGAALVVVGGLVLVFWS
ncbi:MAG TPA: DMT family transporter [Gaiellaceae bacterium]|nr:DMT family transporter [Gaiellaceae bacterium]